MMLFESLCDCHTRTILFFFILKQETETKDRGLENLGNPKRRTIVTEKTRLLWRQKPRELSKSDPRAVVFLVR